MARPFSVLHYCYALPRFRSQNARSALLDVGLLQFANLRYLVHQSKPIKHCTFVAYLYFSPMRRYASAGNSDRNVSIRPSVCLYVRLSVTCRYCVKTKKASVMISSPSGSPKTLVF